MLIIIVIVIILTVLPLYTYCLTARILRPIAQASRSRLTGVSIDACEHLESSTEPAGAAWEAELSRRLVRHDIDATAYQMAMSDLAHLYDVGDDTTHRRSGSDT